MQSGGKEIVSKMLGVLVARLGADRCRVWFGSRTRIELVEGTLRITSPDSFVLERLQNRYRGDIVAAAECALGVRPELAFDIIKEEDVPMLACLAAPHSDSAESVSAAPVVRLADQPAANLRERLAPSTRLPRRVYHRLDEYVVGDGNRLAHSAALSIAPRWGTVSPLTLVGATGSGKSHLLEGIWVEAKQAAKLRRVVYLSAEQFLTQFLEALHGTGLPSFRRKYRDLDLLILDDLQFLAGKRNTVVELQHTVDQLLRDRKQIVFSSDRPPEELSGLGEDLTARLRGGLVVGIAPPDETTRRGILHKLAAAQSSLIPEPLLDWMAAELPSDARALAGAVNRLVAAHEVLNEDLTLDFAARTLADLIRGGRQQVSPHDVVNVVCDVFGLEKTSLLSSDKTTHVSHPRMLAMWLMRKLTRASLTEIGKSLGRKSHTTVLSAETKVEQWLSGGKQVRLAQGECSVADALQRMESRLRRA